jgi:hypothetical protein
MHKAKKLRELAKQAADAKKSISPLTIGSSPRVSIFARTKKIVQSKWKRLHEFMWSNASKKPPGYHKKGYQQIILTSPDGKHQRFFVVGTKRVTDKQIPSEPVQKEIKDLLSKGWRPRGKSVHKSAVNDREKGNKRDRSTKAANRAWKRKFIQRLKKLEKARTASPKAFTDEKQQGSTTNSYGSSGARMPGENLDIDMSKYAQFISLLATMQKFGGGRKLTKVGIDIEPFDLAVHMFNKLDFEPYLYTAQMAPVKKILLTVDSSGSCMDLIPLTRALGKRLSSRPNLELTYSENYNGYPEEDIVNDSIRHGMYDIMLYFGDTDVINSFIVTANIPLIAFLRNIEEGKNTISSNSYMNTYLKNTNINFFCGVNFEKGSSLSTALQRAIEHYKEVQSS